MNFDDRLALTEEGLLEFAAGVEDPGDLLEVEEEPGDDVEAVDEAEREEEAPSVVKDGQMKEEVEGKRTELGALELKVSLSK